MSSRKSGLEPEHTFDLLRRRARFQVHGRTPPRSVFPERCHHPAPGASPDFLVYQGIGRRSRKKPPVGPLFGRVAAQTAPSAPSSTGRGAREPPMSVWTQPGSTELTRMPLPLSSEARMRVRAFSPVLETR